MFPPARRFYFVQHLERSQYAVSLDVNHPGQKKGGDRRELWRFSSEICLLKSAALSHKGRELGFKPDTRKQF